MIRTLLLSSALSVMAVGAAVAADLPTTKGPPVYEPPPPPPAFSWDGFYIGINGGIGAGDNIYNESYSGDGDDDDDDSPYHYKNTAFSGGGLVGGTVGFNYQFPNSNFVAGFEGDFDWASIRGGNNWSEGYADGYSEGGGQGTDIQWLATARLRLGYAVTTPFGNLLPYVTGGAAFGEVKNYQWYSDNDGDSYNDSYNHTWTGWTAGAGLEYAITQNLTFKAEYLYVDLGNHYLNEYSDPPYYTEYEHVTTNLVRVGVNWKFGDWFAPAPPPPPVVAKY